VGVGDWCVLCRGGGESDCHRPVLARTGRHRTRSSPGAVTRTAVWPMTPDSTRRQRRTVGCDLREFAIDRSRTESERYQYVDVCHSKHRVGVRAVAVIAVLVCTRFVAFVKTVPVSAFGQLDQSDEWRSPSMLSDTPVIAVCCPWRPRRRRSASATIELHCWAQTVEANTGQ
jgi:hypothetical protein